MSKILRLVFALLFIFTTSVSAQNYYSKKAQSYFNEAIFLYRQKKMSYSEEYFKKAISKEKKYFESYNGLATLAEYYYNFEKANEYYKKSLSINPKQKIIYYKIARNYHILNKYNLAEETINILLEKQK